MIYETLELDKKANPTNEQFILILCLLSIGLFWCKISLSVKSASSDLSSLTTSSVSAYLVLRARILKELIYILI